MIVESHCQFSETREDTETMRVQYLHPQGTAVPLKRLLLFLGCLDYSE